MPVADLNYPFPFANEILPIIQDLAQYKCFLYHLQKEAFLLLLLISFSFQNRQLVYGAILRDAIHAST